ncbi:hypothetical protein RZN05_01260 [Sphingomonas sp. HF-S4]|uniref:Uncharacterized protein n=1 Tax=Sphingomonas agrestis TaxID=3080540 RepID=A0ABU3Y2G4_9SPHN|nr:hypothetical protein [Sphingomonas sp. HF-S4]MDV3455595.1 hypothetical protein [Sphingomonas sp. HF-S4]
MVSRARRRIADHFTVQHATSADDAVAFVPQSRIERSQFERMLARGVVREAGEGRYWLDIQAYQGEIESRRRKLVPIVIILTVIAAGLILLAYRG